MTRLRAVPFRTLPLVLLLLPLAPPTLAAQTPLGAALGADGGEEIVYEVRFPDAAHHEGRFAVTFTDLPAGEPLDALMSRASPGRYALHEFAKNVFDVSATDGAGRPLEVVRATPHAWRVTGHDGTVRLEYTLYANRADGTYAGIDSTHAHFNMPAAFMYGRGLEDRPVRVVFEPRPGWRVATQLEPTSDPYTFRAPDLQYLMDSPTELSDHTLLEWRMGPDGAAHFRMALHHTGTRAEGEAYAARAEAVLAEIAAVFGGYPTFDYGSYTFLADYLPWVYGDGMEHRNSTIISSSLSLEEAESRLLGTLAHEAIHAWSMERLRDAALVPFAFGRANPSRNLWFGEGFTSYYDALTRVRAGAMTLDDYAREMAGNLNRVLNSPARAYRGPAEMSMMAPFVDAAAAIDETAFNNTFISYYTWGEALGFGLDLLLRQRYDRTLDDYMAALWREYGRHQVERRPARPYTAADLERVLGDVSGDAAFAAEFFDRYVERGDVPDYATLVEGVGLVLRRAAPEHGFFGSVSLRADSAGAVVVAPVPPGTAAWDAGLASGDRLISVAGVAAVSAAAVSEALADLAPGDEVRVVYEQTGMRKARTVRLRENPRLELVTFEAAGRALPPAVRAARDAWLASRAAH